MCHHQHGRWQKFILHAAHAHPTYTVISFSQVLIAAPTCNNLHLDLQRRDSIPHPFSTQGCPNPSLFLADTPATLMTPIFSCRWELRDQGHVLERSRCFAGDLVSGVEVMSFPVACFWSVLALGVQPALGKCGVLSPNSPESTCRSQDYCLWDGVFPLQQG